MSLKFGQDDFATFNVQRNPIPLNNRFGGQLSQPPEYSGVNFQTSKESVSTTCEKSVSEQHFAEPDDSELSEGSGAELIFDSLMAGLIVGMGGFLTAIIVAYCSGYYDPKLTDIVVSMGMTTGKSMPRGPFYVVGLIMAALQYAHPHLRVRHLVTQGMFKSVLGSLFTALGALMGHSFAFMVSHIKGSR